MGPFAECRLLKDLEREGEGGREGEREYSAKSHRESQRKSEV